MAPIPTRIHGILDLVVPAGLLLAPKVLGFEDNQRARRIPRMMALAHVAYSAFTDYETGLVRKLPMRAHLALDAASAVLLSASPWLLGFSRRVAAPHAVAGIMELGIAMSTERKPRT